VRLDVPATCVLVSSNHMFDDGFPPNSFGVVELIDQTLQTGVQFAELSVEQERRGEYSRSRQNVRIGWTLWEAAARLFTRTCALDDFRVIDLDHQEIILIAIEALGKLLTATERKLPDVPAGADADPRIGLELPALLRRLEDKN
jgi:hypothetical protein